MKKVKKEVFAVACTLSLVVGIIVGCGSKALGAMIGYKSESEGVDKKENVIIDIFQFKVEAKEALEKAAEEYSQENPNVKINVQTASYGEDYAEALKSKFASGEEPTIYNIGGTQDAIEWKENLEDLSKEPWVNKAFNGTLEAVKIDGKIVGMPVNQEGYGLIYNKNIFEKAGIDPASIKTYADLEKASAILDSKKKKLGIDAVFALAGKARWTTGLHLTNIALANEFSNVKEAFEAKTIDFKYNKQLKKLLDLQVKYAVKPDGSDKSINSIDYFEQVEKYFSGGKVAMIQQGNWAYGLIRDANENLAKNIGILPMSLEGGKEGSIPVGVPMYWAVNSKKDEATKTAAKAFLNWLYTSDKGKEMIIKDFNFIPAFTGYEADNLQPSDPLSQDILKYARDGKTIPWVFMGYPSGWGIKKLGVDIQRYIAGDMTWDNLVEDAKKTWAEARNK